MKDVKWLSKIWGERDRERPTFCERHSGVIMPGRSRAGRLGLTSVARKRDCTCSLNSSLADPVPAVSVFSPGAFAAVPWLVWEKGRRFVDACSTKEFPRG